MFVALPTVRNPEGRGEHGAKARRGVRRTVTVRSALQQAHFT